MLTRITKMTIKILLFIYFMGFSLLLISRLITSIHARSRYTSVENAEDAPAVIVFGAGLWRDGSPTPVLRDRIKTARDLYFAGKVRKILMSGDNRFVEYNEPAAMRRYAISLGVPDEDIVLDFAGRRTYDTCYRALNIFDLENVILVTQDFHLPRALYTCKVLGIDVQGVPANQREYRRGSQIYWQLRETFATIVALWEVHITHPLPILGEPEPIFSHRNNDKESGGQI
jgi:vancomycin permeability regulator SanA